MDYLMVHGAWHGAWVWDAVGERLRTAGHGVHVVELPSHGDAPGDLYGDVDRVRGALAAVDGPVVVVGHSYGGAVITEAAAERANVRHLVYVAAFMPDMGQSVLDSVGGTPPPWWVPSADGVTVTPDAPIERFYQDCDPTVAATSALRLRPQSVSSLTQPIRAAAWRHIPSTYVVCLRDQAGSPRVQRAIGSVADKVVELESGHSPQLSRPAMTAEILGRIA